MIRVAALGDLHASPTNAGRLRAQLADLTDRADLLLVAGDITCLGTVAEAAVAAEELSAADVPTLAVLGNHDYQSGGEVAVANVLGRAGIRVIEGEAECIDVGGVRVGVAGTKGFGGGFVGASGSEFGEPQMKAFIAHTREVAARLRDALLALGTDIRLALLHYAPIAGTLAGERTEIYPFLGSHLLGEALDEAGADLIVHGHAHGGTEEGMTPGGIPVRNVAQPVLGRPLALYGVEPGRRVTRLD